MDWKHNWETLLPKQLLAAGYRSKGGEYAWKRDDALAVLDLLSASGYVILGVDIWLPTTPGPTIPTPIVYDWDLERAGTSGESRSAIDFIRTFQWDHADTSTRGMDPYFNICAARSDS